jgi:hypothetical protein
MSPHFRIQTTCLLILNSISFKFLVTQKLPTVSYLTMLDKYAIGGTIFLVTLCAWHAIIGSRIIPSHTQPSPATIDAYALYTLGSLYSLFHIVYMAMFMHKFLQFGSIAKKEAEVDLKQKKEDAANKSAGVTTSAGHHGNEASFGHLSAMARQRTMSSAAQGTADYNTSMMDKQQGNGTSSSSGVMGF